MTLAEIIQAQRQIESPRARRRRLPRQRKLRAAGTAATDTLRATRQLRAIVREIQESVSVQLFPLLRRLEPEYLADSARVRDDFADDIQEVLDRIRADGESLAGQRASLIASDMTRRANERNRQRFYKSVEEAIGIDVSAIVNESGLEPVLKMKTRENVGLIKSITSDHFDQIERMVYENVIQGRTSAKSMIVELRELGVKTDARARFIARDQTSKLTAAVNRERNQALGITEYIWRTVADERVRIGRDKTINGPGSHRAKNGKKFSWDKPPKDTGHPGEDYQCRCVAEPIIVI